MYLPPGAPILPPSAGVVFDDAISLLTGDEASLFAGSPAPQWGIFQDGASVVTAESVLTVEYRQSWTIADYPIEEGAFESYDKVLSPFEARVRFATGGSLSDRQNLLNSIAAIAGDTNLYDLVTPEETYPNVNISHYDYRRSALNGVGLLQVDVWCAQIISNVPSTANNTQSPSAASQVNDGSVQPQTASGSQQTAVTDVFSNAGGW